MTATPAQVGDAVLAAVTGLSLSSAYTASRSFWPDRKPEELLGLTVTVVPRGMERRADTRSSEVVDYTVDVLVQRKVDQMARDAEIALLSADVEKVADAVYALRAGTTGFVCVGTVIDPMVAPAHMQEHGVFTGVVTARLRAVG